MTLLERLDGGYTRDQHGGNIHVTTIRVIHHTILWGKTYLSRVLYTERCLLFIQITCTDDTYSDRLVQFTF